MQVADVGEHNPRRLRELWKVFAADVVARFAGPEKLGKSMMGEVASRVVLLEPTNTRLGDCANEKRSHPLVACEWRISAHGFAFFPSLIGGEGWRRAGQVNLVPYTAASTVLQG